MACLLECIIHYIPLFVVPFVMYQPCTGFDLKLGLIFCTYLLSTLIYDSETQLLSYLLAQMA
jgi:hypothetical protein